MRIDAGAIASDLTRTPDWAMHLKTTLGLILAVATGAAQPLVIASGLRTPQKLVLTPNGGFLVTEPSLDANNGRLSYVTRSGQRRSMIENLPSGTEVTGAAASGPSGMALRGRTLYLSISTGDAERRGTPPTTSVVNPEGMSSPIFSSVLKITFSAAVDDIAGTFRMTPALQQQIADGFEVRLDDGAGSTALVSLLADMPDVNPDPNVRYRFSNPWALELSTDGATLYAADAAMNALIKIDTASGRWQRIARFPSFQNPGTVGPPMIDTVPTSVRVYGNDLLVSFLSGFPFPPGAGRVYLVNPVTGAFSPFINGLTSATDVLVVPTTSERPIFLTLEFSVAQTATPPAPGRLTRFDTPAPTVVAANVPAAVSMVWDESTRSLFVLSLAGMIFEFKI
jgi:hypothetical protein